MRNLLQLLGGVAVAGAVAAGTTAFTASGVTDGTSSVIAGGKVSAVAITGAELDTLDFVNTDATNPDRINEIKVTAHVGASTAVTSANGIVSVKANTVTGTGATTWLTCTESGGTWTCADGSNYWNSITTVDVAVNLV
ncbi:hypothetical protein AB0M02_07930 [Actinoplanes sp. NPDC051861]|uniref:hypothetical protein n=1 Tax=Actinoplanes sp. NPDC051861 TaxID=3155170 RepID=UPI0034454282